MEKIITGAQAHLVVGTEKFLELFDAGDIQFFSDLNKNGEHAVIEFCKSFYDGEFFSEEGCIEFVRMHDWRALETIGGGSIEFKRVNKGMFGGFKVGELNLNEDHFDYTISGEEPAINAVLQAASAE